MYTELFILSSLPCFPKFCWSAIPTSHYIFYISFYWLSFFTTGDYWAEVFHWRAEVCAHRQQASSLMSVLPLNSWQLTTDSIIIYTYSIGWKITDPGILGREIPV